MHAVLDPNCLILQKEGKRYCSELYVRIPGNISFQLQHIPIVDAMTPNKFQCCQFLGLRRMLFLAAARAYSRSCTFMVEGFKKLACKW
jgi:hypothetical protein